MLELRHLAAAATKLAYVSSMTNNYAMDMRKHTTKESETKYTANKMHFTTAAHIPWTALLEAVHGHQHLKLLMRISSKGYKGSFL